MQKHLEREWSQRDSDLPLKSAYEALILASIIEKETGVGYERPLIGGVFTQRLKRNMRLQTDPTIIYGLGENFDGDIRFRDLKKDTPYNTYLHAGLTPTPIALPGLDAIRSRFQASMRFARPCIRQRQKPCISFPRATARTSFRKRWKSIMPR
jgi:UPF0755 protein